MNEYERNLSAYVELISDDFQSTFSVLDDNTLTNFLGKKEDFKELENIVNKYIPGSILKFKKTNIMSGLYDIYIIKRIDKEEE